MQHKIKLFCIPFAGGSATYYSNWQSSLSQNIELLPIELAGRGYLFNKPFHDNFNDAIEHLYRYIVDHIDDKPYALFGHSMGSILAYEIATKANKELKNNPSYLFLSSTKAPEARTNQENIHLLSDQKFIEKLKKFGGIPQEVYENQELLQTLIPIIKADFSMLSTYTHNSNTELLQQPISLFGGDEDEFVSITDLKLWQNYTKSKSTIRSFSGGHFYLTQYREEIIKIINETLTLL